VITKVEKPTAWINPIVIVEKTNRKATICLDPRDLNRGILPEHYPLKTVEEMATKRCKSYQYSRCGLYQNCEFHCPRGRGFAPGRGETGCKVSVKI
jgi:hypothetical protein